MILIKAAVNARAQDRKKWQKTKTSSFRKKKKRGFYQQLKEMGASKNPRKDNIRGQAEYGLVDAGKQK